MNISYKLINGLHWLVKYALRFSSTPIETMGFIGCDIYWEDIRKFEKEFKFSKNDIDLIVPILEEYNILDNHWNLPFKKDGLNFVIDYQKLKFTYLYCRAIKEGTLDVLLWSQYKNFLDIEHAFQKSWKVFEDIYKINIPGEYKIHEKSLFIAYIFYQWEEKYINDLSRLVKEKYITGIKINTTNNVVSDLDGNIVIELTKIESKIIDTLQKKANSEWISKTNLKKMTNQTSIPALEQSIKQLRKKIKNAYIKDLVWIDFKRWEQVYVLIRK